jgi:hypothetical protein
MPTRLAPTNIQAIGPELAIAWNDGEESYLGLENLRRAYAKQPDPDIAAHLGEVLWARGQHDEARRVWDEGRKKDARNKALLETIRRLTQ